MSKKPETEEPIPPKDDLSSVTDLAWDLANEANSDYRYYVYAQKRLDDDIEKYGKTYVAESEFWGCAIGDRNRLNTRFEVKSQMAAIVMRQPDCPFSTKSMREYQDYVSNHKINWGVADEQMMITAKWLSEKQIKSLEQL